MTAAIPSHPLLSSGGTSGMQAWMHGSMAGPSGFYFSKPGDMYAGGEVGDILSICAPAVSRGGAVSNTAYRVQRDAHVLGQRARLHSPHVLGQHARLHSGLGVGTRDK